MPDKASYLSMLKYGLIHPRAVVEFYMENKRLKINREHPYKLSEDIRVFEKYQDFLKFLIDFDETSKIYNTNLSNTYFNLIKEIESVYGKDKSISVLSLDESISLYFLIQDLKPEIVVETGVSDGMSSFIILSALNENGRGKLYSVDLADVGMPKIYGKEPGWIVDEELRKRWTLIYGKTSDKLPELLEKLKHVDIFLHDSEHSYENMQFEFSLALKYMKEGSLLLSDDARANSAFEDLRNIEGFNQNRMCFLIGRDSDLGALMLNYANKSLAGKQST